MVRSGHILFAMTAALLALAGCRAVRDAREVQRSVEPLARGAVTNAVRVDLTPCVGTNGVRVSQLCEYALANRPAMTASMLAVEDARLAMRALAADAPLVSATPWNALHASAAAGRSAASRSAHADRLREKTYGDASGSLSLELLVWDFGRHDAEARAQAENVLAAELESVRMTYRVVEDVSCACFAVLENDALLEVARTNEFEYAEHLRQAEDRLAAGVARSLDVTRARLDYAQACERTIAASNALAAAEADFLYSLGLDAARASRADVFGPFRADFTTCWRAFPATDFSADEAFAEGRTNAPAVRLARTRLKAADARVDAALADLNPSVGASVSFSWTDPLWLWRWGVNATQSLLTGGRRMTAVERATIALKAAAAEVEAAEQELSKNVETAVAERETSRQALRTAETSVRRARENLETVRRQYELGEVGAVEYTTAVADWSQALGSRVSAFYRGQAAEARLFALTGRIPTFREERADSEEREGNE